MTKIPTTKEVASLAQALAQDGTQPHADALLVLADAVDAVSMSPGASAVLRNLKAPEATRARAFLSITREWDQVLDAASRWSAFEQAFQAQAAHWEAHQELRKAGDTTKLWESRTKLDSLRNETAQHQPSRC